MLLWCRETILTLPRVRVFIIDGLRTPTSSNSHHGANEVKLRNGRIVRDGMRTSLTELRLRKTSLTARERWDSLCINNPMANWKVIEIVSGNIEAVSGLAAETRPGTHERTVWKGEAADKAEALKCAEKADRRVDLEWMRIRHERDLNIR